MVNKNLMCVACESRHQEMVPNQRRHGLRKARGAEGASGARPPNALPTAGPTARSEGARGH